MFSSIKAVLTLLGRWISIGVYVGQFPIVRMFTLNSILGGLL